MEHAGATLSKTDDSGADNEETESAAEKQTEGNVDTVSYFICQFVAS